MAVWRAILALWLISVLPNTSRRGFQRKCACGLHAKWCTEDKPDGFRSSRNIGAKAVSVLRQLTDDHRRWESRKFCEKCVEMASSLTAEQMKVLGINPVSCYIFTSFTVYEYCYVLGSTHLLKKYFIITSLYKYEEICTKYNYRLFVFLDQNITLGTRVKRHE